MDLLDTAAVKLFDCCWDDYFKIVFKTNGVLMVEGFNENLMRSVRAEEVFENSVTVTAEGVACELFRDPASEAALAELIKNLFCLFI